MQAKKQRFSKNKEKHDWICKIWIKFRNFPKNSRILKICINFENFWNFWKIFENFESFSSFLQKISRFGKWHPKIQSGTYRQTCLWQKVDRKKLLKCQRGERLGGGHYKQENNDKHLKSPTYWMKINLKIVSKIKIKQFRVQKENPTSKWGLTVPRPL